METGTVSVLGHFFNQDLSQWFVNELNRQSKLGRGGFRSFEFKVVSDASTHSVRELLMMLGVTST